MLLQKGYFVGGCGPGEEVEDGQAKSQCQRDISDPLVCETGPWPELAPEVLVQGRHWGLVGPDGVFGGIEDYCLVQEGSIEGMGRGLILVERVTGEELK